MKYQLLFVLLLCSITTSAQFIDIGTTWTYEDGEFFPLGPLTPEERIAKISIIGDTIIDNELYHILDRNCECVDYVRYIREEGLQTYIYFEGEKLLLYDYSLKADEILSISTPYMGSNDIVNVKIVSTEMVNIDGHELVLQHTDSFIDGNGADWGGMFLQGVGSLNYCMFPKSGLAECGYTGIRCFENSENLNIAFQPETACDAIHDMFSNGGTWTYRKYGSPGHLVKYKIFTSVANNFEGPNYKVLAEINADGSPRSETIIRLQTQGRKVYWLDSIDSRHLLFDFSKELQVGDTVTYELPPNANLYDISSNGGIEPIINPYQYVINDISTIDNEYSAPKKSFTVEPIYREIDGQIIGNFITNYISGVGSMYSFIRRGTSQVLGGEIEKFICYETYDYFTSYITNENCDLTSSEDLNNYSLIIYPNPVKSQLTIKSDLDWTHVEVYDISGQLKLHSKIKESIDVESLTTGVYLLKLLNSDLVSSTAKFVKI